MSSPPNKRIRLHVDAKEPENTESESPESENAESESPESPENSESESESDDQEYSPPPLVPAFKASIIDAIVSNMRGRGLVCDTAVEQEIASGVDTAFAEQAVKLPSWKDGLSRTDLQKYSAALAHVDAPRVTLDEIMALSMETPTRNKLIMLYSSIQALRASHSITIDYFEAEETLLDMLKNIKDNAPTDFDASMNKIIKNTMSLDEQIKQSNFPDNIKAAIYTEFLSWKKASGDSQQRFLLESWIKSALRVPFTSVSGPAVHQNVEKLVKKFNEKLSCLNNVLEPLIVFLNKQAISGTTCVIGLVGAPGVGKTTVGKIIAEAWGRPFEQISFGGMIDSSVLIGQHRGWLGAHPGRICRAMQNMGVKDGVLFFDEIDKLGETVGGRQVQYSLLHILDSTQNSQFVDLYLGETLPIDLSQCLMICTMNSIDALDPALLNRMYLIKIPNYTPAQKRDIINKHIIPRALAECKLDCRVQFTADAIGIIIERTTKDPGARGISELINTCVAEIALLLGFTPDEQQALNVSFAVPGIAKGTGTVLVTTDILKILLPAREEHRERSYYS